MRYWAIISIAVLISPFLIGLEQADATTWYNSSWLKARKITIDQTDINTADLTNYPLYVNLTSVNIGTDAQADCDDFVFTDSTNVTKLDHEIEQCDSTADWAEFWVEIPSVDSDVDTVIFMYYDNAAATDQQNTQATWNSNFQAVWHLNGTFIDSTSSPITCTNTGTSASADEYMGDSRDWDGIDDILTCGSASKIDNIFDGGGTFSAWIKPATQGEGAGGLISMKGLAGTDGEFTALDNDAVSPTSLIFGIGGVASDPFWRSDDDLIPFGSWSFITVTFNDDSSANNPTMYINGTSITSTQTNGDVLMVSDAARNLCLGNIDDCLTTRTFDDKMDEFRYNNIVLAAEWIKADWECQKGAVGGLAGQSCITVGSQGIQPNSIVTVTDEYALEDTVTVIGMGTVNVSDEYALEDTVTVIGMGTVIVSDEYALEDSAGTGTVTIHDEFALEEAISASAPSNIRNAIAIYVNKSPFIFGLFSNATRMICTGALEGAVIYNTDMDKLNVCNGVAWITS